MHARRSQTAIVKPPCERIVLEIFLICSAEAIEPDDPGHEINAPKQLVVIISLSETTLIVKPIGNALVRNTEIICGCVSMSTANTVDLDLLDRSAIVIASPAAVASSSSEALAISKPVISVIMV